MNEDQTKSVTDEGANVEGAQATEVQANGNGTHTEESQGSKPLNIPEDYQPVEIEIKSLLDAGAHFGHKVEKWNPKMLPYIYGERNGIHIINLDATLKHWVKARKFVVDVTSRGGSVLFVGTKMQAQEVVREAAERCGAFYIN
ncbi:MAG: 30S ribosomal protein S2, partial [Bdellovibrionales bacterium]|nr:30S ribosomal protein S2 [Bdellovibrionales bacterium]